MPALIPPMLLDGLPCWTPRLLWGRPFDFWGGAGEGRGLVWVISEKISYKLISRGKNYCKETPGEKISYTEKKKMLHLCMSEKNLSPEVWENNFYPNQITRTPLTSQRRGARRDGCISMLEFIPAALSANGSYCTLKHCLFFLTEIKDTTSILVAV